MEKLNIGLLLTLVSLNSAVFVYVAMQVVEYLKWKRSYLEKTNER